MLNKTNKNKAYSSSGKYLSIYLSIYLILFQQKYSKSSNIVKYYN